MPLRKPKVNRLDHEKALRCGPWSSMEALNRWSHETAYIYMIGLYLWYSTDTTQNEPDIHVLLSTCGCPQLCNRRKQAFHRDLHHALAKGAVFASSLDELSASCSMTHASLAKKFPALPSKTMTSPFLKPNMLACDTGSRGAGQTACQGCRLAVRPTVAT